MNFIEKGKIRPEYVFAGLGLFWGILFLVAVPPFQVPDEDRHFYRAVQIAEGGIRADVHEGRAGVWMPESLLRWVDATKRIRGDRSQKTTFKAAAEQFHVPLEADRRTFRENRAAIYSPIPYLASALSIRLGLWMNLSPASLFYSGRLSNLIIWLVLVYAAIRIAPFFKWFFCFAAMTPMSVYVAASLSADSLTNGLAFFSFAWFLYLAYGNLSKIKIGHIALMFLLMAALALCKNVYFTFAFLALLIPPIKIGSTSKWLVLAAGLFIASLVATFLWYSVISDLPIMFKSVVSPKEQICYILSHPVDYIKVLVQTVEDSGIKLYKSFVGWFGWTDTWLPKWHTRLWMLILIVVAATDGKKEIHVSGYAKVVSMVIAGGTVILIFTLLYIYWNPVGADTIIGLQGRYLISVAPLVFFGFYNRRLIWDSLKSPLAITLVSVFMGWSLAVVYQRFYVIS